MCGVNSVEVFIFTSHINQFSVICLCSICMVDQPVFVHVLNAIRMIL